MKCLIIQISIIIMMPVPLVAQEKDDELIGRWKLIKIMPSENRFIDWEQAALRIEYEVEFTDKEFIQYAKDKDFKARGKYHSSKTSTPKQIDVILDGKGEWGIYKIEDDKLFLRFASCKENRPQDFTQDAWVFAKTKKK